MTVILGYIAGVSKHYSRGEFSAMENWVMHNTFQKGPVFC